MHMWYTYIHRGKIKLMYPEGGVGGGRMYPEGGVSPCACWHTPFLLVWFGLAFWSFSKQFLCVTTMSILELTL